MSHKDVKPLMWSAELSRKRMLRPHFLNMGLTVGQGQPRILQTLYDYGPLTQRELADRCFLDVTTMSRTLDRMEGAGLLGRETHPDNRRSYLICLTDLGREKARQVIEIFQWANKTMLAGIDEQDVEIFYRTLEKIIENIQKEIGEKEGASFPQK